jgi:hypothetical protein
MSLNDGLILFISPFLLANIWIEMVMPALPALLSYSSWQMFSNKAPIFCTVNFD